MEQDEISTLSERSPIALRDTKSSLVQTKFEAPHSAEKYQVNLGDWTGPYDILLKVIDEKEMNLFDLNISDLLFHYLEYLKSIDLINLDEAGEFLVVAATLAQIKSKLLLPQEERTEEDEEEASDPRDELVQYLIEYKKFKEAAEQLRDRPILNRDVFLKGAKEQFHGMETEGQGKLFQLVKGFQKALLRVSNKQDFEIEREEVSVSDRFQEIFALLKEQNELDFQSLLPASASRSHLIASFLAVLEMVRLKKVKIFQWESGERLFLRLVPGANEEDIVHSEFDEETTSEEQEAF